MNKELFVALFAAILTGVIIYNSSESNPIKSNSLLQFTNFQSAYGKSYSPNEDLYRFRIFADNFAKIQKHNSDKTQTYTMGITQFADMTTQQFIQIILMKDLSEKLSQSVLDVAQVKGTAASSIDWRQKNVLNPVKNQGQCGSCWAFSTTGVLQSNVAVSTGKLNNFSQQQLVDCCGSKGYQCLGCNGAWPEWALNYINKQGIVSQSQYPYTGKLGSCKPTGSANKYLNSGKPWTMIQAQDIQHVKSSVSSSGPVSICVDASNWSFYRSGVFSNCGTKNLNHAVLVVGYQQDGVWIVRNSWGAGWGQNGYINLGAGNTCGLAEHAVVPNLA